MSEIIDEAWADKLAKFQAEVAEANKQRMQLLVEVCKVLQENNIASVMVRYNGSGDEGETEPLEAFSVAIDNDMNHCFQAKADDELTDLLNEMPIPVEWKSRESSYFKYTHSVGEGLSDFLVEFAPNGYEDGEGGTGYIVLNTATATVEVDHGNYVTEVHWHKRKVNAQGDVEIVKTEEDTGT